MAFNQRKIMYSNVITFPSSKSAGSLTLVSEEFLLTTIDKSSIILYADDASKITNSLTIYVKGSFDEGITWMTLGSFTDLTNGSGVITAKKDISYAPLLKVEATFNATGALASGHGIGIDVVMEEDSLQLSRKFFYDVLTVPAGATESGYFDVTIDTGSKETASFTVTGAPSTPGNITVADVTIAVLAEDDAAGVATKIAAGTYTDWDVTSDGADVLFTGKVNGNLTNVTFVDTDTTGTTIGTITTVAGVNDPVAGTVVVAGETITLTDVSAANTIATQIAAHSFTAWTASSSTNRVTLVSKALSDVTDLTATIGTATGVYFSSVTETQGIAVTSSQTVLGDTLSATGYDMIKLVKVSAIGVTSSINNSTLLVKGSLDGTSWYNVDSAATNFDAATVNFVTSGFVGKYAKVALVTAANGSIESGHDIVASATILY